MIKRQSAKVSKRARKQRFEATQVEDVFASASYKGPRKTLAQMNAAVLAEARKRGRK
jgi:hypothetical protein